DEHVGWYAMYGMSMRPVPASWEEFQAYWERMCREVLEDNPATVRCWRWPTTSFEMVRYPISGVCTWKGLRDERRWQRLKSRSLL
ncbi:DUF2236 domain-containing protein, partial [Mycolicibacterium insubricum]|nr:DUF2236 domain-containing protein [Mycolicibacterium insubricum]